MNDNDHILDWLVTWQMRWVLHANDCAARVIEAMNPDLRRAIAASSRGDVRIEVANAYSKIHLQDIAAKCARDAACESAKVWAGRFGIGLDGACGRAEHAFAGALIVGAALSETITSVLRDDQRRVTRMILWNMIEGSTNEQIMSQVALTRKIGIRSMEAAIRTAIAAAIQNGAQAVWAVVSEFDALIWLSVLDSVTSEICRYRHGRVAPIPGRSLPSRYASHPKLSPAGARPPAHPHCRSIIMALLRSAGLPTIPTYYQWLRRQPSDIQSEALGPARYNIWKRKGVSPDRFHDEGRRLTLAELRARI